MNISLDSELRKKIEETAKQGGYTSTSEVVREALRAYFALIGRHRSIASKSTQDRGSCQGADDVEIEAVLPTNIASGEPEPLDVDALHHRIREH